MAVTSKEKSTFKQNPRTSYQPQTFQTVLVNLNYINNNITFETPEWDLSQSSHDNEKIFAL